jgi:simple sugar transport system ATP-binding protein
MTVIDNVLLTSVDGPLDRRAAASGCSGRHSTRCEHQPDAVVEELSVEATTGRIIKALYQGAKVLILTSRRPSRPQGRRLSTRSVPHRRLGVVFISHKLHEVAAISQRVSVLRHGRIVSTMPTAGASPAELAELMVGRSVAAVLREERRVTTTVTADDAPPLLKVESLSLAGESGAKPLLHDIALTVRSGEILALAGVSGNDSVNSPMC